MRKDKEYQDRLKAIHLELANHEHMSDRERYDVISKINDLFKDMDKDKEEGMLSKRKDYLYAYTWETWHIYYQKYGNAPMAKACSILASEYEKI